MADHSPSELRRLRLIALGVLAGLCALAGLSFVIAARLHEAPPPPPKHPLTARQIAGIATNVDWFERSERADEEQPDKALDLIGISPGMVVADVGAGSGYMTVRLAPRVGATGKVYANDLQPGMLAVIDQRVRALGLSNVELVQGAEDDARLPAGGSTWRCWWTSITSCRTRSRCCRASAARSSRTGAWCWWSTARRIPASPSPTLTGSAWPTPGSRSSRGLPLRAGDPGAAAATHHRVPRALTAQRAAGGVPRSATSSRFPRARSPRDPVLVVWHERCSRTARTSVAWNGRLCPLRAHIRCGLAVGGECHTRDEPAVPATDLEESRMPHPQMTRNGRGLSLLHELVSGELAMTTTYRVTIVRLATPLRWKLLQPLLSHERRARLLLDRLRQRTGLHALSVAPFPDWPEPPSGLDDRSALAFLLAAEAERAAAYRHAFADGARMDGVLERLLAEHDEVVALLTRL